MAIAGPAQETVSGRDHGFHPLRIARIVRETEEASSFVLEIPSDLEGSFAYRAGQFCTFRTRIDDRPRLRCYSMSSSPDTGDEFAVTVKRVPGGVVSNWMIDSLTPGDLVETTRPAGVFCLGTGEHDVLAFAAGSGITPVYSIVKTALATTRRTVRLLYANRAREAVIFDEALDRLALDHPGRLEVLHHLDVEEGFVDDEAVRRFTGTDREAEHFVCGPEPFMEVVERALTGIGVESERIRVERFTPLEPEATSTPSTPSAFSAPSSTATPSPEACRVTVELEGRSESTEHRPGTTILQTARQMGMAPPFSCEAGNCATCMAKLVDGEVTMCANNALTDDEVAEGWVLTCQSVPTTSAVHVVYEEL
jgi:3-ketosteroid 9alpha-monooxygenase subunit B